MRIRPTAKEQKDLVVNNLGLVRHCMKKFKIAPSDYDDIFSIGTFGLIKAVQTFDSSKHIAFSSYACICIANEIKMHYRKEKKRLNDVSLSETLPDSKDDNLTLEHTIEDSKSNFVERIEDDELIQIIFNIILNILDGKYRLAILYSLTGMRQNDIALVLSISRSSVSRMISAAYNKVKKLLSTHRNYKEVYSMSISGDSYKISFSSKDVKNFNKIFATLLQNVTSAEELPNFKLSCNQERIVIIVPAHPESFSFIAKIIQEIDDFNMVFVSTQESIPSTGNTSNDHIALDVESKKPTAESVSTTPSAEDTDVLQKNFEAQRTSDSKAVSTAEDETTSSNAQRRKKSVKNKVRNGSEVEIIRKYMLSLTSFTRKELAQHFPEYAPSTINNALFSAKSKGLIKSASRGAYIVNKN